jgi:hypothetical protein
MDRTLALMSTHPEIAPRLRATAASVRFDIQDLDLVVNLRAAGSGTSVVWEWSDAIDWTPKVRLSLDSPTLNRYFQGKESVVTALARRRVRASGDITQALALLSLAKPLSERYRAMIAAEYAHLLH